MKVMMKKKWMIERPLLTVTLLDQGLVLVLLDWMMMMELE